MPGQTGGPSSPGGGRGSSGIYDIGAGIATQTGQAALGQIMGMIFGNAQDKRQIRQQEKLMNMQILGQKHMLDYDYAKQLQMWKDTNYSAQLEQMKLAGINPGLLYGMSGGGGVTTGNASGNVTGGHAAGASGEAISMAQTMMGLALQRNQREIMQAQVENIKADTRLKEADAQKTAGVDTTESQMRIQSLSQGIENAKAQKVLTELQTRMEELRIYEQGQSMGNRIEMLNTEYKKGLQELESLTRSNDLNEAQFNDKIKLLKEQVANISVDTLLKSAEINNISQDTKLKFQEVKSLIQRGEQGWAEIYQQGVKNYIDELDKKGAYKDDIKDMLDKLLFMIPLPGGKGHTPIRGLHQR